MTSVSHQSINPSLRTAKKQAHAVVIGSGFGGLAAAVRLGARGYRVTVLEKLDKPGGRAYVYQQDGFTFDGGPTVITAPFLFEDLWKLCGKKLSDDVELRPITPFYRIRFDDGKSFDYTGDAAAMRSEVARFSPDDVAGYEAFMRASEATYRVGFEELAHVPFNSFMDMVKILPDILRLQGHRTVYGLVSKYVKNPYIRTVLSFHPLLVGGNPFTTTAIYGMIAHLEREGGVHFAMGLQVTLCADHRVAGDDAGQALFVPTLGSSRPLRYHNIAKLRSAVPYANAHLRCESYAELLQYRAGLTNGPRTILG